MDKRIATHSAALNTGRDVATCAIEGFPRLEKLLKAIERFAALAGVDDLGTLAKEGAFIADNYANLVDCDAEQFRDAAEEIAHGQ
ncbi:MULTISPECIES: hypothetical protein [unclassified Paraburkholderia]|uniref:hypothetical protein n=1 Tax=unclassified Paraburkholderia TaxID=2615204 RepID=UPI00161715DF|nr:MULTISPECIES: hypothetical protein [unclassified Paraburkholderia]MBB5446468.1 hypothetical protein [Paraburkholderia sp. WSM4177]MBB5486950.1 hypothetical protein [Paraburkholderia sp. WSM4180]